MDHSQDDEEKKSDENPPASTPEPTAASAATNGAKNEKKGAERRIEPRRIVHERCEVAVKLSADEPPVKGILTDISNKGLGLLLEFPIRPTKEVSIEIRGSVVQHQLNAKSRWCQKIPSTGRVIKTGPNFLWRVGMQLLFTSQDEVMAMKKIADTI